MGLQQYTPQPFGSNPFATPRKISLEQPSAFSGLPTLNPNASLESQQNSPQSAGGDGLSSMIGGLRDIAHEQQQTGLQKQREFLQPGRHLDMSGNDTNANPGGSASIQAGWGWDKPAAPAPASWSPSAPHGGGDLTPPPNNLSPQVPQSQFAQAAFGGGTPPALPDGTPPPQVDAAMQQERNKMLQSRTQPQPGRAFGFSS